MTPSEDRRDFLKHSLQLTAGLAGGVWASDHLAAATSKPPLFKISLTEYSFHRMMAAGKLDNLDYTAFTKKQFGIDAVEYWNNPFFTKAENRRYIREMRKRSDDAGVRGLVILIDGEGNLGDPDKKKRIAAVDKHKKWVLAAKALGCHSIRVNARSRGSYTEQQKLAADGLRRLCEFAAGPKMNVIVENHGGLSSNGKWLVGVMKMVGLKNCGTLPDFGNFHEYDRYLGTKELMPYAKSVSAKSHDFDKDGNETGTDFYRIMKIVVDAGYHGYAGIEYEGRRIGEIEGVRKTKALLERVRAKLSKSA